MGTTFTFKLALAFTALWAPLYLNMRASHADQFGDSRWCHVENKGDIVSWDCDYESIEECQPVIVTGGGYCAINPYWQPNPPQSESTTETDTTPAQGPVPIPRPKPH